MKDAASRLYDNLLILRCQGGDEAALEELIARYSPGLRFYLAKLIGNADAADDLLQDTWIDVYRKVNRLADSGAFAAWLYRIARDKAYRRLRARHDETAAFDEESAPAFMSREESFTREEIESVRAALDQLLPPQREILLLRFIEDMSYEEIAAVIARPVGTVRSRIYHAKIALRRKLELKPIERDYHHE